MVEYLVEDGVRHDRLHPHVRDRLTHLVLGVNLQLAGVLAVPENKIYAGKNILRLTWRICGRQSSFSRARATPPLSPSPHPPLLSSETHLGKLAPQTTAQTLPYFAPSVSYVMLPKKISLHLLSHLHPHVRSPTPLLKKERVGYQENYSNYPIPFHSSKKGGFVCCAIVSSEHSAAAAAVRKRVRRRRRLSK